MEEVKYLTFYAFSSENLKKRPESEKNTLYKLMKNYMNNMLKDMKRFDENQVKINFLGRTERLPENLQTLFNDIENKTKRYNKRFLNFCIVYDGRDEIVDAVNEIIKKDLRDVDRETIKKHLYTRDIPPADLIIRTGMRDTMRLSGFLLWDSAYSEFYFTKTYWPAFTPEEFEGVIHELKGRERRHGR